MDTKVIVLTPLMIVQLAELSGLSTIAEPERFPPLTLDKFTESDWTPVEGYEAL